MLDGEHKNIKFLFSYVIKIFRRLEKQKAAFCVNSHCLLHYMVINSFLYIKSVNFYYYLQLFYGNITSSITSVVYNVFKTKDF